MDHKNTHTVATPKGDADMRFLVKPRGKGYSLRMATPEALIGTMNPWTGKPFCKEIKLGLRTRRHAEALRTRDVRIGQVRQLEADALAAGGAANIGGIIDLSPEAAEQWRQMRAEASDAQRDGLDYVLADQLEAAAKAGKGKEAEGYGARVFKGAMPLQEAMEAYLAERSPGNAFGFKPLATTTSLNVRSTVTHLAEFLDATGLLQLPSWPGSEGRRFTGSRMERTHERLVSVPNLLFSQANMRMKLDAAKSSLWSLCGGPFFHCCRNHPSCCE